jgi:hypothetical protein
MEKQILEPWIIPDVDNKITYNIEAIHDDYEGFRILLRANNLTGNILRITFNNNLSYRNTDESFLLKLWEYIDKETLGKTFYLVSNSAFVGFFNESTENIYKEWNVVHYAIYTTSDCIDILSDQPPIIEWLV